MNDSSGRPQPLDFEKPIAELESELEDMREKACSQELDLRRNPASQIMWADGLTGPQSAS